MVYCRSYLTLTAVEWGTCLDAPEAFASGFPRSGAGRGLSLGAVYGPRPVAERATNIWNDTPQPDRGGKTSLQLSQEGPGAEYVQERWRGTDGGQ